MIVRRIFCAFTVVLFLLTALFPACRAAAAKFGYEVELTGAPVLSLLTAAASVGAAASAAAGRIINNTARRMFAAARFLVPLALLNAIMYARFFDRPVVAASLLIHIVCAAALLFMSFNMNAVTSFTIAALIAALIAAASGPFTAFLTAIGNFGAQTVVRSVTSPDGEYIAEVVNSDHGALGGSTTVTVRENVSFGIPCFEFRKKPSPVYIGSWSESEGMELHWRDASSLVINSEVYIIK